MAVNYQQTRFGIYLTQEQIEHLLFPRPFAGLSCVVCKDTAMQLERSLKRADKPYSSVERLEDEALAAQRDLTYSCEATSMGAMGATETTE